MIMTQVTPLEKELLDKVLSTPAAGYSGYEVNYAYLHEIPMDTKKVTGLMMSLNNKGIVVIEEVDDDLDGYIIAINDDYVSFDDETYKYSLINITL